VPMQKDFLERHYSKNHFQTSLLWAV
jgi:hypothetical protein